MPRPHRVAFCLIHGIGAQRRTWADDFVREVRRTVELRWPGVDVYPLVVWWAPITQRYEDVLTRRYRNGLGWRWLRQLVIGYGGDVIAYQAPSRRDVPPPWTYRAVHGRVDRRLRWLQDQLGASPGNAVPLVTVAHSLGSVIFSDFVYDAQAADGTAALRTRYGLSLQGLFTLGSPIALYALRYPHLGFDRPIALEAGGTWVNALYRADVIGYPLGPAGPAYAAAVRDWVLPTRWWPCYWTPVAHLAYWSDRRLIDRVAAELARAAAAPVP
jgi:hypothetical protein